MVFTSSIFQERFKTTELIPLVLQLKSKAFSPGFFGFEPLNAWWKS